jgi:hypothetical protein
MIDCDANGSYDPVKLSGHHYDNTAGSGRHFLVIWSYGRNVRDTDDVRHFHLTLTLPNGLSVDRVVYR